MAVQVQQTAEMKPGEARLICGTDAVAARDLELAIVRVDLGAPRFLHPAATGAEAWVAGEKWFRPEQASRGPEGVALRLGPAATWHLKPHMPYLVRLRDGLGCSAEDRMSWPVIRLPAEAPRPMAEVIEDLAAVPVPEAAEPADAMETGAADPLDYFAGLADGSPEPVAASPEDRPEVEEPARSRWPQRAALVLVLAALIGGGAWAALNYGWPGDGPDTEIAAGPAEATPPETTLDGARTYLQADPAPGEAAAQAQRFEQASVPDGAFLLRSYAAKRGDAVSARIVADHYNPKTFEPGGVVKAPDSDRAAELYEQAAKAGDLDAMRALSELLKGGTVGRDDAPERALFWQKQAEAAAAATAGATEAGQ